MSEHRQFPRTSLALNVAFQVEGGPRVEAICRDLSLGGMYIETATPAPYGTSIRVFMNLTGLKQEVAIEAIVRWCKPSGMGVQFGRMGARETYALTGILAAVTIKG